MQDLTIEPCVLDARCESLRGEVRAFLTEALAGVPAHHKAESWSGFDAAFSRRLGQRGWIGMTWPKRYGGHERSMLERYVVLEELLAAGAPVGLHWIADRQSGPLLLRYGSERIKNDVLPRIAAGDAYFGIGMSEPDTGSDLASLRSRATQTAEGWVVNGTKVWTTLAHHCHYMIALLRTDPAGEIRHAGLSQFVIDLSLPGVHVRPIRNLMGHAHFNEVVFDDVLIPHDCLVGLQGDGWKQVNAELGLERSGPERYLSSVQLMTEMLSAADPDNPAHAVALGSLVAEYASLRHMSVGIAGLLARGDNPALLASIVKDQGALLEQKLPEVAHALFDVQPGVEDTDLSRVLAQTTQAAPSFSLRGGTREILRGIIAKGLGLR